MLVGTLSLSVRGLNKELPRGAGIYFCGSNCGCFDSKSPLYTRVPFHSVRASLYLILKPERSSIKTALLPLAYLAISKPVVVR